MARNKPTFSDEELQQEIWKPVYSYEVAFEVSNLGRARRTVKRPDRPLNVRINTGHLTPFGHVTINIGSGNVLVHRLVMAAFVGPCPKGFVVNHIDAQPANNRLGNLEYVTPKQNTQHCIKLGRFIHGDRNGTRTKPHRVARGTGIKNSRLNPEKVRKIRTLLASGISYSKIAKQYGVAVSTIADLKRRRSWQHVV